MNERLVKPNMGSRKLSNRKIHLELIRAFSIILVIFNHTGERGFFLFTVTENPVLYWIYMFMSVACKVAVPLFFMVSGALLIDKEESILNIYRKRVLRILIVLVGFSLFQYIATVVIYHEPFSILTFLKELYSSKLATAYGFLYSYLGIMIVLPFVNKAVKHLTKNEFLYGFALVMVLRGGVLVRYLICQDRVALNPSLTANLMTFSMLYFVAGYYFEKRVKEEELSGRTAFYMCIVGFIAIIISCLMTQYRIGFTGMDNEKDVEAFFMLLTAFPTFAIYYCNRLYWKDRKPKMITKKLVLYFGGTAFGVMLIENLVRHALDFVYRILCPIITEMPACIIWVLSVWLAASIVICFLKKLPVFRRLL